LGAEACIRHLEATGAWVVQVYGIPYPGHDYVGPDMAQAAVLASDYLWSRGRRAQALVVHDPEASNWRSVTAAFRGRLRRHGLAKNAGRVFACECPSDFDRARGLAKVIAEEYPDCDGILACNDDVALGLVAGFRELELEVPRDLEVVAHNNTYPVRIAHPPMPSTQYDLDEAARSAVEIALMRMEDPELSVPPKVVKLEPVFVSPTDQRKPLR
jgi:LacI family transcriptional regulator